MAFVVSTAAPSGHGAEEKAGGGTGGPLRDIGAELRRYGSIELAIRQHRTPAARSILSHAIADDAQKSGAHDAVRAVDRDPHELENRDAGRLHVDAQHLVRIATGEKYIGADDLGGVIRADPQQTGRLEPQQQRDSDNEQRQSAAKPAQYFHAATS